MKKINIAEKFTLFDDHWAPKIIGESNAQYVKLAKGQGELVWHSHAQEDELFLVFSGKLTLQCRDETITLGPGEMIIVPKGVEHKPIADEETLFMLIEPKSTAHTGDVDHDQTVSIEHQPWI